MRRLEQLRPRQRSRLLGAGQELDLVARERLARVLSSEDFLPEHRAAPPLVDAMVGGALLVIVGLFVEPWKAVVLLVFVLVYQQVEKPICAQGEKGEGADRGARLLAGVLAELFARFQPHRGGLLEGEGVAEESEGQELRGAGGGYRQGTLFGEQAGCSRLLRPLRIRSPTGAFNMKTALSGIFFTDLHIVAEHCTLGDVEVM
jgi:hypothetical protein